MVSTLAEFSAELAEHIPVEVKDGWEFYSNGTITPEETPEVKKIKELHFVALKRYREHAANTPIQMMSKLQLGEAESNPIGGQFNPFEASSIPDEGQPGRFEPLRADGVVSQGDLRDLYTSR